MEENSLGLGEMDMAVQVRLRPTGSSILVGFVDQPSLEIKSYRNTLNKAVEGWQNALGAEAEDPQIHTTLHAGHYFKPCGFLGIGPWSYISLTLLTEQGLASHLAFLGHIRGQHYFHLHEYSMVVASEKDPSQWFAWAKSRSATLVLKTRHHQSLDDRGKRERPSLQVGGREIKALAFDHDYGFFPFFHSVSLKDIGDGCQGVWPEEPIEQPEEQRLLGFYQLKLHPLLTLFDYKRVKLVTILVILESIFKIRSNATESQVWPTFARPFLSDGYFDVVVLLRGLSLKAMDRLMQPIKTMTIAKVWENLPDFARQDTAITDFFEHLPEDHPWFSISHSTLGIPNLKLDQVEDVIRDEALDQNQVLRRFRQCFQDYNHNDELKPNTLVTAKVGRIGEIPRIDGDFRVQARWEDLDQRFLLNGRYDYRLFPPDKVYNLGEFLALLQYSKWLFRRAYCQTHKPVMQHRIQLPLISTKTNLASEANIASVDPRLLTEDLHEEHSLCLMWLPNIHRLFDRLGFEETVDDPEINRNYQISHEHWFTGPGEDNYCQIRFYQFLKARFGNEVTPGTLQRVFTAFCAIDGLLADPMLFHLYLDVANYLRYWMKILFTARSQSSSHGSQATNGNKPTVEIVFFHPHTKKIAKIFPKRFFDGNYHTLYVGLEALFLNLIYLIQEVTDHRQTGSYPNYDRSFSRISDFCLQHSKKMMAISWMINDLVNATCQQLPRLIDMETEALLNLDIGDIGESCAVPSPADLAQKRSHSADECIIPPEVILTLFTHAPEVHLLNSINCLSINIRQLTSAESLCLVAHEIGHAIAFRIKTFSSGPHSFSSDPQEEDLWEEVMAELFQFKLCYAPLEQFFQGVFNQGASFHMYAKPRVCSFEALEPTTYDLYDDFIQATIFQFLMLPAIRRAPSFEEVMVRLSLLLFLLKGHAYPQLETLDHEARYDAVVQPFWDFKFPALFNHLGHLEGIPHHDRSCWHCAMPDHPEREDLFAQVRLRTCKLYQYFEANRERPLGTYISFLFDYPDGPKDPHSRPPQSAHDFFNFRLLDKPETFFQLLAGILPESLVGADEGDCFAAAFQLMGMINMGFVQDLHLAELTFVDGYPGFKNKRDQQSLAKLRRLIHSLIGNGAMRMIHQHLKERGFYEVGGCWER